MRFNGFTCPDPGQGLARAITLVCLALALPAQAEQHAVPLGVVVATPSDYLVNYAHPATLLSGVALSVVLGGPISSGVIAAEQSAANSRFTRALNDPENDLPAYQPILQQAVAERFEALDSNIDLTVLPATALRKKRPDYDNLGPDTPRYIAVVLGMAGLGSPPAKFGELRAFANHQVRVYDTKKKKRILKERVTRHGLNWSKDPERATSSPDLLVQDLPFLTDSVAAAIYWQLYGNDILHLAAKPTALSGQYPSITQIRAQYAEQFTLYQPISKVLFYKDTGSPYTSEVIPKRYKQELKVVTTVDVLAKELGQDFEDLPAFVEHHVGKLAGNGWSVSDASDNDKLTVPEGHTSYALPNPQGGTTLFYHKQFGDFVLTHQIDLLGNKQDKVLGIFEKVLARYLKFTRVDMT